MRLKGGYRAEGNMRQLKAGEWFVLTGHHLFDQSNDEADKEFVACRLQFSGHNNLPGDLKKWLQPSPSPEPPPYWVKFDARKRGLALVPAYAHTQYAKPTARGLQTATVTGPEGEEVYTDKMGRVKIQFHWQRQKEHPEFGAAFDERSSCWVRVATPGAGGAWGHQSLPRIGQEVLVDFVEGDIDRPLVTGVIHNGNQSNPWFSGAGTLPGNRALTGIKTKEHHGQQYGELLFDDTTEQVRVKLSAEHGKTQLNQGYLTHPREDSAAEARGEGFELRTDRSGAIRAAEGILLTAHAQRNAHGKQLARDEAIALLELALSIAQEQGKSSSTQHAEGTDTIEQERLLRDVKQWEDGSNTARENPVNSNKAIVTMTAPDGIALATEANVTVAAGSNLDQIAAQDANTSVGRNLRLRVGEAISLFVQRCGMKLIAAAGKIQVQAQSDEVEIGAAKKLRLYSLEEIVLDAPKITLRAQSAGVEYSSGITSKTTGPHVMHAANHAMPSAASMSMQLPGMPQGTVMTNEKFVALDSNNEPVTGLAYEIQNEQGGIENSGSTGGAGDTSMQNDKLIKRLKMFLK